MMRNLSEIRNKIHYVVSMILVIDLNASREKNQSIHTFSLMIYDFQPLRFLGKLLLGV